MAEAFIGQIRMFGFGDAPEGWALCDGTPIQIVQNMALYSVLHNTFGGDGRNVFDLPDLRGRVPVHAGSLGGNFPQEVRVGEAGGSETKTLAVENMNSHTHHVRVNDQLATSREPDGRLLAQASRRVYRSSAGTNLVEMNPQAIGPSGQGKPMDNMQRSIVFNFCIALTGIHPA